MRKIYSLLALMLIMAVSATAQKRYDALGFGDDGQLADITPGQTVVLKSATTADGNFLNITDRDIVRIQSVIDEFGLFTFEVATDSTFYLKSVATGKYLENPAYSSNVVRLTESKLRAASILARHPFVYENRAAVDTARKYQEDEYDYSTFTIDEIGGLEDFCWRFTAVTSGGLYMFPADATWNQYYNNNTWEIYEAVEKNSLASLEALQNEFFPNETSLDIFIAGDDPGQVDENLVVEVFAARDDVVDLLNSGSEDDDANWAAYNRFMAAYQACKNGVKPMREGYFYFSNWRTESTQGTPIEDNAVFENESDHRTYWSWTSGWTRPEQPSPEDANYIYHIFDNGDGTFYLQNYGTKRWLGYITGNNVKIPTTETPEEKYRITIHPTQPGMFSVISTTREASSGNDGKWPAMHAAGDYNAIVFWTPEANASAWYFNEIPESDILALEDQLEGYKRLQSLETLLAEAESSYNKGFSYKSEATPSSEYAEEGEGLVTDPSQLWTNAKEPDEGPLEDALDCNAATFFHSNWHGAETADGGKFHNLVAELSEAVSAVDVKITKRMGSLNPSNYRNNAPYQVHFYTTNDLNIDYDENGDEIWTSTDWHDQGTVMFEYPYTAELDGEEYSNMIGINSCAFDGEYRYVRMDVEKRLSGDTGWFNLGEIRFYTTVYDPETSIIEAVPADKRKALEDAMEVAKNEIIDEAATQETLDRLQKAYDEFVAVYPDPQRVVDLLAELDAQVEGAEEGSGLGYFEEGAKAELSAVLETVRGNVKDVMSINEVNAALETLTNAFAVFNGKLHMPANGAWLMIRSATESDNNDSAAGSYLYADGNGASNIHWGGYSTETGEDANINGRLNYFWKAIKHEDGSYSFFNAATGTYMGNQPLNNKVMTMANTVDEAVMTLRSAQVGGLFNLVQANGVFANAQPAGNHNLVTWNSASGTDNSAFEFVNVDWYGTYYYDRITKTVPTPLTLPFEVTVPNEAEATLYSVIGYKGNDVDGYKLVLKAYAANTNIPAATPFIVKMAEANSAINFLLGDVFDVDNIVYNLEPAADGVNGLHGTIDPVTLVKNCGKFNAGLVLLSEEGDTCPANSAYLTDLTLTTEEGDLQLDMEAAPRDAIFSIVTERNANNAIYDLQGRRVLNAQKGLYIVNGKKVFVK
ncbi:MAG: hypothetical protein IJ684_01210 [Bacteroidales bacterium]|nr:hypothetical protein [Alloprevotella sp.]MBR1643978.1 hypothetical protein [Bacteroidales bacterium]